jgi:hypothetical protein
MYGYLANNALLRIVLSESTLVRSGQQCLLAARGVLALQKKFLLPPWLLCLTISQFAASS